METSLRYGLCTDSSWVELILVIADSVVLCFGSVKLGSTSHLLVGSELLILLLPINLFVSQLTSFPHI